MRFSGIPRSPLISQVTQNISRARVIWVSLIVCVANGSLLVLQLIAGRLLAPYIGVSLETWTAVIGVFLTGIALGNFLGGRLADRAAGPRVLGVLLLVGAVLTAAMVAPLTVLRSLPLGPRIGLSALALCFPVSFVLSLITPVAIRSLLPDVAHTGRVVGLVYALGTLGSLGGNFLTGFVLVAYWTTTTIVLTVAAALAALGTATLVMRTEPAIPSADRERTSGPPPAGAPVLSLTAACAIVFVASFCSMSLEVSASRLLAPIVGVSLYSWTGIIGVVLIGITAGNYGGGRLADSAPRLDVLGSCLFFAGLFTLIVLFLFALVMRWGGFDGLGLVGQIVAWATVLFLAPMYLLATISPQVTRLAVGDLGHAGRIAGRIYAWSCLGAIAGTFATGWGLIPLLYVKGLICAIAIVLIVLSACVGRPWRRPAELFGCSMVIGAAIFGVYHLRTFELPEGDYYDETNYYTIRVYDKEREGKPVKALMLDHLEHSYAQPGNPDYLGYPHEDVQAEFARWAAERTAKPRILVIGGGGYTFPRWAGAKFPDAIVEVAEIDKGVTEAAHVALGLPRDTRIVSHHMDGRQFVEERAPKGAYQLVVQDAVNDVSVPYHIMTKEYNDAVRALLAPGGVYLLTVIDAFEVGQLMRSAVRTLKESFPHVALLGAWDLWKPPDGGGQVGSKVWVIYASQSPLDLAALGAAVQKQTGAAAVTVAMPDAELDAYLGAGPPIVLTDAYAPVDNLIAILFQIRHKQRQDH